MEYKRYDSMEELQRAIEAGEAPADPPRKEEPPPKPKSPPPAEAFPARSGETLANVIVGVLDGGVFLAVVAGFLLGALWHPVAGVVLALALAVPFLLATLLWRLLAHILSALIRIEKLMRESRP